MQTSRIRVMLVGDGPGVLAALAATVGPASDLHAPTDGFIAVR
jgi:hypothetical protein